MLEQALVSRNVIPRYAQATPREHCVTNGTFSHKRWAWPPNRSSSRRSATEQVARTESLRPDRSRRVTPHPAKDPYFLCRTFVKIFHYFLEALKKLNSFPSVGSLPYQVKNLCYGLVSYLSYRSKQCKAKGFLRTSRRSSEVIHTHRRRWISALGGGERREWGFVFIYSLSLSFFTDLSPVELKTRDSR